MNRPSVPLRLLVLVMLGLAAGCAPMPAAPPLTRIAVTPPPERHVAGVPVAGLPAPAGAASAPATREAPRLIRGTDRVVDVASTAAAAPQGAPIDLRFEDAPVREVVHAILGDLLKLDYVIYPPLEGRVTISTSSQVAPDVAVFLLEAALQANGLAMARDARGVYHLGKAEALRGVVPAVRHAGKDALPPGQGAIVVPLRYIGAAEMASILRPLAPADAIVRVDTVRNLLVLTGSRTQAEGWLSLVSTFDIDLLAGMSVGVFSLKYATVREVEAALQMMGGGAARAGAAPAAAGNAPGSAGAGAAAAAALPESHPLFGAIRVLPIERLNSVVVVTPRAAYLDEARRWIERLDQPSNSSTEARLHVYAVRNGSARHLGEVLNGIYGAAGGAPGTPATSGVAPGLSSVTARTAAPATTTAAPLVIGSGGTLGQAAMRDAGRASTGTQGVSALQLTGNVRVVADELNNAILVYGSAAQFERIEEALRRLDAPPTQVLIEASIIEVTLTDELKYGLQWYFTNSPGENVGTGTLSNLDGGVLGGALAGFSYTLRRATGRVPVVLNALAEKSLVRVISTPSLMVLDNHTASIVVGNQQPVLSAETLSAEGNVRTTSIQYKDTGVSLAVTPSVGSGDMVTMNISQAVTDVGTVDSATGQRTFLQRQIGSKVAVRSGDTLVLGGLIRDNNSDGSAGVPGLHEIPVLGGVFGTKSREGNRTELLVLITPRVARSDQDAREIGNALRDRMKGLAGLQGRGTTPSGGMVEPLLPHREPAGLNTTPEN